MKKISWRLPGLALLCLFPGLKFANAAEPACTRHTYDGVSYALCIADLEKLKLRLHLGNADSTTLGSLNHAVAAQAPDKVVFATNAGMFRIAGGFAPSGLYVDGGKQQAPLNLKRGKGNFYWKPNGVFYVSQGKAYIATSESYAKMSPSTELATQSGPMLVVNGQIHEGIAASSGKTRYIRNGVCATDPIKPIFAISEAPVSMPAFARFFRDHLGCANALYLDGSISSLYAPELQREDMIPFLGPMIVAVVRPAPKSEASP